ncbi:sporulation protein YunB [Turicibacter sanguinis]|jgi:sporulation protein yunB|uniref:sporulation protein YunB n=1 Tax=Turicibacter sanguinis TaxID=154288 RepID=UPI0018AAE464|nr:sporulation protein YunB [Turicibacter sanguinis]MDB8543050.1 sporulation protein YunB [Turicibacter sanguinis]MDB8545691.1 sporulation protein YunB [Turicibacter sanguinis]MDB8559566.1 sporulation protein YunB [Turicibacter sanguinis]MDB8562337.1 sporulation protein YunB [Turicibacter sanguinis]MDB8565141.1 sporulation protein YunB [Turicibacter sanguinis]
MRRRRRRKRYYINLKKWRRIGIAVLVGWGIYVSLTFMYQNLYPVVMTYAKAQTTNIATLIIKEGIAQSELVNFKIDEVIKFKENDEGLVSSIIVNTPVLNRLLVSTTQQIEEKLLLVESGDLTELGLDAIYGGPYEDGVLINIPWAAAFNLSLFHDIGPSFPVSVKLNGSTVTDIVTEVKPYGINNALLEILLKVDVKLEVLLPFKSDEVTVSVSSPLVLKMITGQTPQYYYIGNSSASPMNPISGSTDTSSSNSNTQTPAPNPSPEQSVAEGMENLLLE